jgi:hypothetical protein
MGSLRVDVGVRWVLDQPVAVDATAGAAAASR